MEMQVMKKLLWISKDFYTTINLPFISTFNKLIEASSFMAPQRVTVGPSPTCLQLWLGSSWAPTLNSPSLFLFAVSHSWPLRSHPHINYLLKICVSDSAFSQAALAEIVSLWPNKAIYWVCESMSNKERRLGFTKAKYCVSSNVLYFLPVLFLCSDRESNMSLETMGTGLQCFYTGVKSKIQIFLGPKCGSHDPS